MKGTDTVLDSKIYSEENLIKFQPFHMITEDIKESYKYKKRV